MVEFRSSVDKEITPLKCVLSVNGTSNVKGNGVGIVIEGANEILVDQALKFKFTANNN